VHRAIHQELEGGRILADPLAQRILGADAQLVLDEARRDPSLRGLRLFIAVRARIAEDALARAVPQGFCQLVILGAGLDTFAYRSPLAQKLRIFEIDHPATQNWKRERLAQAAIPVPDTVRFVPLDFEREQLPRALAAGGFDFALPSFFSWLGVVPYLTEPAVFLTLGFIASLPTGAQVVFDYANPLDEQDSSPEQRQARDALAARVALVGEHFRSHFETDALHAKLAALGFCEIDDLGPNAIGQRYFHQSGGAHSDRGGHIVRASTRLFA
jgi:methyltransferase (TIGR00027 family)